MTTGTQPPGGGGDTRGHALPILQKEEVLFSRSPEAPNGILCNGVLLWLEANVHNTAKDLIFRAASANYDEIEIVEAKEAIYSFCNSLGNELIEFIGKYPIRKNNSKNVNAKKEKELEDLIDVMEKLRVKERLPMFVATTKMMLRNPPIVLETENPILDPIAARMTNLESILTDFMKSQSAQAEAQSAQIAELTQKMLSNSTHSEVPIPVGRGRLPSKRPRVEDDLENDEVFPALPKSAVEKVDSWSPPVSYRKKAMIGAGKQQQPPPQRNQQNQQQSLQHKNQQNQQHDQNRPKGAWKRDMKVVRGAARCAEENETIRAAPVSLVAFNVAKDATADNFKNFVTNKGLEVLTCELLTKFDGARTNSFKITIDSKNYDKSLDPQYWPYRVGVRMFRHFRAPNVSWANQSGQQNPALNVAPSSGQNIPAQFQPSQPMNLSVSNRFESLENNIQV